MKRVVLLIVFALLLAGCGQQEAVSPPPSPTLVFLSPPPSPSPSPTPTPTPSPQVGEMSIDAKVFGSSLAWVEYPEILLETEGAAIVNQHFKDSAERSWNNAEAEQYGLDVTFTMGYNAGDVISVLFKYSTRVEESGEIVMAVGYKAETIDVDEAARVVLDDVFTAEELMYLQRMFLYAEEGVEVPDFSDAYAWFDTANFYLEADAVVLFFPPYTVEDSEDFYFHRVPFSELADILADWVVYE